MEFPEIAKGIISEIGENNYNEGCKKLAESSQGEYWHKAEMMILRKKYNPEYPVTFPVKKAVFQLVNEWKKNNKEINTEGFEIK